MRCSNKCSKCNRIGSSLAFKKNHLLSDCDIWPKPDRRAGGNARGVPGVVAGVKEIGWVAVGAVVGPRASVAGPIAFVANSVCYVGVKTDSAAEN